MAERRRSSSSRVKRLGAHYSGRSKRSGEHKEKEADKILVEIMTGASKYQSELKILVTGKTGQGKSTLINGVLGEEVAPEGARAGRCTTEVTVYAKTVKGVPVKVFDSPGLQDRTEKEAEYIRGMREKCKELSLVLYCTKMINTRLADDDKHAMLKLTKSFGEHFWDYAIFVLTFANCENVERRDDRDEDEGKEPDMDDDIGWERLKKSRFQGRLKIWKEELQKFLIDEVGVSSKIAKSIPVVPAGDSKPTRSEPQPLRLPDRDNWFSEYWAACCARIKGTRLFLQLNKSRIVIDESPPNQRNKEVAKPSDIRLIVLKTKLSKMILRNAAMEEAEDEEDAAIIDDLVEDVEDPSGVLLHLSK